MDSARPPALVFPQLGLPSQHLGTEAAWQGGGVARWQRGIVVIVHTGPSRSTRHLDRLTN